MGISHRPVLRTIWRASGFWNNLFLPSWHAINSRWSSIFCTSVTMQITWGVTTRLWASAKNSGTAGPQCDTYSSIYMYYANHQLCISEYMVRFKGQCHFRKYMPYKPRKRGFKMFSLCDSVNIYSAPLHAYAFRNMQSQHHHLQHVSKNVNHTLSNTTEWKGLYVSFVRFFCKILRNYHFFFMATWLFC